MPDHINMISGVYYQFHEILKTNKNVINKLNFVKMYKSLIICFNLFVYKNIRFLKMRFFIR